MPQKIQAEIFMQTLEEMRDHDRECQKARLRLKIKAQVDRFTKEFGTGPGGSQQVSGRPVQSRLTGQKPGPQMQDE